MKLRVTLERAGGKSADLGITFDSAATVGDLAEHLWLADPQRRGATQAPDGVTLSIKDSLHHALDPSTLLAESAVHSGQTVALTQAGTHFADASRRTASAFLVVHDGPDRGREFPLASGSNVIGRGRSCDVKLTDPMVSRQHVRINVTDHAEVIDMGSANGVLVNEHPAQRERLQPLDQVTIGDTNFTVRVLHGEAVQGRVESTAVAFLRSPRLVKIFPGRKFAAPEIPEPPQPQRFPILVLIAPVLLGGAMYWFTKEPLTLLFVALSPLMMIGSYFENKLAGRAAYKKAMKQFDADVVDLLADVNAANAEEIGSRLIEHPSVMECLEATRRLTNLLWTRRLDSPGFADLRLGLGPQPSRSVVELPDGRRAPRRILKDLVAKVQPLSVVWPVPVLASPAQQGGLGVAGPRSASVAVARSLIVQAATLHSPEDLVLAAVGSARTAQDWEWMKWVPHCHPANSVLPVHLAATAPAAASLLGSLEELIDSRSADKDAGAALPIVLLMVESDAPAEFGRLVEIAERGWRWGVHVVWVASDLTQLPAACRVFVETGGFTEGMVGYLHTGDAVAPVQLEPVTPEDAVAWAKAIAPITDLTSRTDDSSDVPRAVNLLSLQGFDPAASSASVIERWQANRSIVAGPLAPEKLPGKPGNLRAVIGQNATGPHSLDLRSDGPHALVGGTTGSGKSELLQTWILSMAASHSPQRLNFLLVDYKGGSAFADCNRLPHTVGLVTDLAKNGVRRALTSLNAELHYRERLITEQHRCKDLPMMEKKFPGEAPPSLVIVVDEFAALVNEVPEFVDGVVNVAQRGRSLGLHMILATQQPSGVIKGPLRANTNLRLALRVADVDDSNDILGSSQAAFFDQDTPGRAVSKTGPGRLVAFQTGYVGGHSDQAAPKTDVKVEELSFGPGARWEKPEVERDVQPERGAADIARIVDAVNEAFGTAGLPQPRKPWLPDLAPHYDLAHDIPTRRMDSELVFGMLDDPDHQQQLPVAFRPDVEGNLIVYGASGSGKTTFLRTIAVAAGFTVRGGPCHVYGLDFASGGLGMLEVLPHVGSIISGSDDERVQRLLTWLRDLIAERALRYRGLNASTITEYRKLSGRLEEPRVLLLLDGIAAFRSVYDAPGRLALLDMFYDCAAQGRGVGVHMVLTSDQRSSLPTALAASVQQRVVMRMADSEDYGFLGAPATILDPASPPGRAIIDGREAHVAVLGPAPDAQSQAAAIQQFAASMQRAGSEPAFEIRHLPPDVRLASLPSVPGRVTIGMASEGFGTVSILPVGALLLTGPAGSGRSTALETLIEGLKGLRIPVHLFSDRRSPATELAGLASLSVGADDIVASVADLRSELSARAPGAKPHAYVIEGVGELAGGDADYALCDLISDGVRAEQFVVGEGEVHSLGSAYDLLKRFKASRSGIMLQPSDSQEHLLQVSLPRCRPEDFVVGRGFYVDRGKPILMQMARVGPGG